MSLVTVAAVAFCRLATNVWPVCCGCGEVRELIYFKSDTRSGTDNFPRSAWPLDGKKMTGLLFLS